MKLSNSLKTHLQKYGPWALVTGASSGIGREIALNLAEANINLILSGRNILALKELSDTILTQFDVKVQIVQTDLNESKGISYLLSQVQPLDIGLLIASAGFGTSGEFLKSSLEEEVSMLEVNCKALFILTHHFARQFSTRGKGGIILMSSMVGFQGVPYAAHYAATKAYVQSLAEALALELKSSGIDVLAAAPGPVNTRFGDRANMQLGNALKPSDIAIPILKALGRRSTVLPGLLTKILVGSLRTVPRWAKIRIMMMVMGGMTKHQRQNA